VWLLEPQMMTSPGSFFVVLAATALFAMPNLPVAAQSAAPPAAQPAASPPAPSAPPPAQSAAPPPSQTAAPALPKDYVIGVEDVLNVFFWTAKEMSLSDALVRPDGKISVPLINDIQAAGLTPLQLAEELKKAASKFVRDGDVTVIVNAINSRKVYVVGEVARPGPFQLASEMTVLQAIGEAGGFLETANKGDVTIVRTENGQQRRFKFNYNDVVRGRNIQQDIRLLPGDTILVR
jgi:polysaccharide export outer membrane protein